MARCPVLDPVHRVQRKLRDFLRKVTLAEIATPAQAGR
jgi:DNA-binding IscR family transcriptional regulator